MPALPEEPGLYVWAIADTPMYVGQTTGTLRKRLGSNGYATITAYNTLAKQPGRTNGGQQTNCRINALATNVLRAGAGLDLWYRVTTSAEFLATEAAWMRTHGFPQWNRQDRRGIRPT